MGGSREGVCGINIHILRLRYRLLDIGQWLSQMLVTMEEPNISTEDLTGALGRWHLGESWRLMAWMDGDSCSLMQNRLQLL